MNAEMFAREYDYATASFPAPRDWQTRAISALREGFRQGHTRQILCAPVGGGKTMVALQLLHGALLKRKRATFVCDRTVLIEQTSRRADEYGLDHGVVQANHWRRDNHIPLQIASIQTIQARGYWPQSDLIVNDEAHTIYKAMREKIESSTGAIIGLTATPCTQGLGKLYTNLINAATMHELTEQGILVPMRILECVAPDMKGAATSGGEWTDQAASSAELKIVGDVVAEWLKHGENRKTIAFGPDIAYCMELVARFTAAGVASAAYTSDTDANERKAILEEFDKPDSRIRILASVAALGKGFDVPDVSCIIMARPLRKSLSEFIQALGRGLRCSPATSKTECVILDHSGNTRRFMADLEQVYFNGFTSLDEGEKLDKVIRKEEHESKGCPSCGYKPFLRRCMACGYERVSNADTAESAGVMREIRLGKKVLAPDAHHLWQQLCFYAAGAKKPQGRAAHLFRDITGDWPPRDWHIDFTDKVRPTGPTLSKIKSLNIRFVKGRENGQRRAVASELDAGFKRAMAE